ncbi:MAG TPA: hypothetical protein VFX64_00410 [Candidatus Nitrosotalea sp.]|nr:hypothetical protein [Candidatus Nitrosotalea sp.]
MKFQLLAAVMITGLLFSAGSVYLNHAVFADDSWSDITARQQAAEQKAMAKYMSYYQFANLDQSKRNWDGLTSVTTDETSRGRNIEAQAQVSLQNAIAQFDNIHVRQLADIQSSDYAGLNSISTDTQGRDRNAMIDEARSASLAQAQDIVGQLVTIQQNYANFQAGPTTDSVATYDRQTQITKNLDDGEAQAAALVSQLAKIDQVYVDLSTYVDPSQFTYKPTSVTNEQNHGGRNLTPQESYALEKAVIIFNQIHERHLALLQSNYYGLNSVTTDENGADRNAMLAQAKQVSMDNALRIYNSYYNGTGLK